MLPEVIEDRRRHPGDDLISALVNSEIADDDGTTRPVTDTEFQMFIQLLAVAGTETVARLLSWTAVLLARNPDQRALVAATRSSRAMRSRSCCATKLPRR